MAKKILFRTGLEADSGVLDVREPGFTSDSLRACIGDGTAAKFLTSETLVSIATAAPAALTQMKHTRTSIICDTDTAAASIAIDIQAGALVVPSICEVLALGSNAARFVNVTYRTGYVLALPIGRSRRFIWNGAAWYLMGEEYYPLYRTATAWDISSSVATYASPATWDLSALIPLGTKAVLLHSHIVFTTAAETGANQMYIWNYDLGSAPSIFEIINKGSKCPLTPSAALTGTANKINDITEKVLIGASRKLYYGLNPAGGPIGNALIKGIYL